MEMGEKNNRRKLIPFLYFLQVVAEIFINCARKFGYFHEL